MQNTASAHRQIIVQTEQMNENDIMISVIDNGHGISTDKHLLLFESFFTTKKEGTGLGLAIVRSIIEAHRGTIMAKNNRDQGATFSFTLPIFNTAG